MKFSAKIILEHQSSSDFQIIVEMLERASSPTLQYLSTPVFDTVLVNWTLNGPRDEGENLVKHETRTRVSRTIKIKRLNNFLSDVIVVYQPE